MLGIQNGTISINLLTTGNGTKLPVNLCVPGDTNFDSTNAIYANPGKSFINKQIVYSTGVPDANVESTINDAIAQWIATYSERYDDIDIQISNSGGGTKDILICIFRNF